MDPLYVYVLIAVVTGASWAVQYWLRSRRLHAWPVVQGTVEFQQVRVQSSGRHETLVAEIAYSYNVMGDFYSGYHTQPVKNEAGAGPLFAAYPKGSSVFVHYDPNHPDKSVVEIDKDRLSSFAIQ